MESQGTQALCTGSDPEGSLTMSPQPSFGMLVRRLREDAGLSRRELAERVHCAEVSVRKIEAGERKPSRSLAAALAVQLQVSDLDRPAFLALAGARERKRPGRTPDDWATRRLIGRDAEIQQAIRVVRAGSARPLTITGPGGVGKTSLARVVMERLRPDSHAAWFVDLSTLAEPDLFFETLAEALSLPGDVDVPALIAERAGESGLLVLDNLEHLPGIAPDVQRLLNAAPSLALVTTSRTWLALDAERVLELRPLATITGRGADADALPPAVELFAQRARLADPAFAFDAKSLGIATEICQRLDGLPLAIELVAARVRLMTPQRLLERLIVDGRLQLGLVVDGLGGLPDRQHNLTQLIDWSYRLLSPAAQATFRRLSVFNSEFVLEAAEAVCAPEGQGLVEDIWNTLTVLADSHLLDISVDIQESRFRMLETVREFARRQIAPEELVSARAAHLRFFHRWISDPAGLQRIDQALWIRLLQNERANIYAALDTAIALGERSLAADLCLGLFSLWIVRGYFHEALHWVDRVMAMPSSDPWPLAIELRLRNNSAICAQRLYEFERAFELFNGCLTLARANDDRRWIANLENNLGRLLLDAGRPAEAGAYLERACFGYQTIAEDMLGYALVGRGEVLHFAGAYTAAAASFAGAIERLDAVGHSDYAAWARLHRIWAQIDSQAGPVDDIDPVADMFDRLGDQIGRAAAHLTRARLAWSQSRWNDVEQIADQVLESCSGPAFRWVERETILLRVDLALLRGSAIEAEQLLRRADPTLSTRAFGCLALAIELRRVGAALFDEPSAEANDHLARVRDQLAALGDHSTFRRFFAWFSDVWWTGGGG